ncbi:hypothetical protein AQS8620_00466 [Aquimixticola soesokkakensis]|uniref:Uncharacterized protein n=1 Tax=Aquimixticola soesokkakensis TaxID=1519096 RepID=A0A1Y5RK57_9RHOB|nr:hypothetical protein AQS8620_00466 [Aquimixticola soesokkakensis]
MVPTFSGDRTGAPYGSCACGFGEGTSGEGVWRKQIARALERGHAGDPVAEVGGSATTPRSVVQPVSRSVQVMMAGEEVASAATPQSHPLPALHIDTSTTACPTGHMGPSGCLAPSGHLGQAEWIADTLRGMERIAREQALPEAALVLSEALDALVQRCRTLGAASGEPESGPNQGRR